MSLVLPSIEAWKGNSCVTDTVMKLVCVYTPATIKAISDGLYTPLWYKPVSLSHTHTHTHTHDTLLYTMQNSVFEQSIANT